MQAGEISVTVIATGFPAGSFPEQEEGLRIEPKTVGAAVRQQALETTTAGGAGASPAAVSRPGLATAAAAAAMAKAAASVRQAAAPAPPARSVAEDGDSADDVPSFLSRLRRKK